MITMINILRKITTILFSIIVGIGVIAVTLLSVVYFTKNFNVSALTSDNMSPAIHSGSWVIGEKISHDHIKIGDIVIIPQANASNITIVGRVMTITNEENKAIIQIKGDNNPLPNPWNYTVTDVYKYSFSIPVIGFLAEPIGVTIFGIFILILSVIYVTMFHSPRPKEKPTPVDNENWTAVDELRSLFEKEKV